MATDTATSPVPKAVDSFLSDICAWAMALGYEVQRIESEASEGERIYAALPERPNRPAEGFGAEPFPPLRDGGEWVVDFYNLTTQQMNVATYGEGCWLVRLGDEFDPGEQVILDSEGFARLLTSLRIPRPE